MNFKAYVVLFNALRFTEAQMRMPRGWLSCVTPRRSRSSSAAPGTTCTCASRATSAGTAGASAPPSRPCREVRHGRRLTLHVIWLRAIHTKRSGSKSEKDKNKQNQRINGKHHKKIFAFTFAFIRSERS